MSANGRGTDELMPLSMARPGTRARVTELRGGLGMNRRLASLGIVPGCELVLVRGGPGGPIIVTVGQSQLVLGRGISHRIMIQPLQ